MPFNLCNSLFGVLYSTVLCDNCTKPQQHSVCSVNVSLQSCLSKGKKKIPHYYEICYQILQNRSA